MGGPRDVPKKKKMIDPTQKQTQLGQDRFSIRTIVDVQSMEGNRGQLQH